MSTTSVQAVTFDAAGTLFTVAEPVGATYARIAALHGIDVRAIDIDRRFRAAFAAAPPLAFPGASPARLADHERAWWYALVRATFGAAASHPRFDACFTHLFAHYAHGDAWRVFPDARPVLETLRGRACGLAVVSNFDARVSGILEALGLAPFFDRIVYSSRSGAAKPAAAIFREALALLGVTPDAALHVGDNMVEDVEGARGAGLRAVLLDRSADERSDVTTIASLTELSPLLAGA